MKYSILNWVADLPGRSNHVPIYPMGSLRS